MDRAAVRPAPRVRATPVDQDADRPRPARDLRRDLGQADVGRAEPQPRRPATARQPGGTVLPGIRSSSSAPSRCCGCSPGCASMRSSGFRSARCAGNTSTTRDGEDGDGGCVCSTCRRTRPAPRSPSRSTRRSVTRSRRGRTVRPDQPKFRGSQDGRAGRCAARLPRREDRGEVRQPGPDPAAVPKGRGAARGRPRL